MHKKFLFICWVVLVSALFSGFATSIGVAQEKPDVEFSISTDRSTYVPSEPIIVTAMVTNKSDKALKVRVPSILGIVSVFTLEGIVNGQKKNLTFGGIGGGVPGWQEGNVELASNESSYSSSELLWQHPADYYLEPGKYSLRANYHWSEYTAVGYEKNRIESKPVEFNVVEGSAQRKQEREAFTGILKHSDDTQKKVAYEAFLAQYPDSFYRVAALEELVNIEWKSKNQTAIVELYRRILKEKISPSKQASISNAAALTLAGLGDLEGAIVLIKDSTSPVCINLRTQLEEKLKAK